MKLVFEKGLSDLSEVLRRPGEMQLSVDRVIHMAKLEVNWV